MDYAALKKCSELRAAHIIAAASSSEEMEALLARFAEIAAPGSGAPVLLALFARLATTACDWIEGELRVELSGDASHTKISASTTIGAGFREKLFADTVLRVPLEEFSRGIARAPRLIEPLSVNETGKRIVLSATQAVRRTSLPPAMVQIDPKSFMVVPEIPSLAMMGVPRDIAAQALKSPEKPKVVVRKRAPTDPGRDPKK